MNNISKITKLLLYICKTKNTTYLSKVKSPYVSVIMVVARYVCHLSYLDPALLKLAAAIF